MAITTASPATCPVDVFTDVDPVAVDLQPFDGRAEQEFHAELFARVCGEFLRELARIAGLVDRRIDAAGNFFLRAGKPRLELDQPVAADDLDRQSLLGEIAVVVGAGVKTLLRAEEIEDALGALVVVDAGFGSDRVDALAGIERQPQLDLGVGTQPRGRALAKEAQGPQVEIGIEAQLHLDAEIGRVERAQEGLQRRGRGPGRRVAGRNQPGIGVAGSLRRRRRGAR